MIQLFFLILAPLLLVTYTSLAFGFFQYCERKRIERLIQVMYRIGNEENDYREVIIQLRFIASRHCNKNKKYLEIDLTNGHVRITQYRSLKGLSNATDKAACMTSSGESG